MSFNPTYFIRSASPYFSPYSSSFGSFSSSSTSESLSLLDEPERSIEHLNQLPRSEPSEKAASPPRRFVLPDTAVTTATPMTPLLPPYQPLEKGSAETTTLQPPKHFAGEVTNPTSQDHSALRTQAPIAITLTSPYDFYYPSQPPTPFPLTLDPKLFITLQPHNYPELILPQLRDLILNIEYTMDTHLMRQLPNIRSLLRFLSSFPDFGLITTNLPAFQAQIGTHFTTADTREEQYFAVKPEPELKMILRIFDERYTDKFPRRAACLIYPDDFEHQPAGEKDTEEPACRFPDPDKGGVDMDTGASALVYRQGWGGKTKYVVTASFAGDVGVQYPEYHF
ncbi:uncharacterized protein EAE97_003042 [Botrytis byssoidea]|uniref:Uncharacterized protein n=1 Tax=Botrytis byssoidea TaxID=139641 RepID=A0A9P5M4S8_9HELO|nr:uncharacterized protein EAE97_003042 [Botrytis byssoidea]KAF7949533.1 hypothetical protein EAE97_003042 [Botrytis byssoidea]